MNIFRKYNLIKKIFIPILALAIFLAPVSPSLERKGDKLALNVSTNRAQAVLPRDDILGNSSLSIKNYSDALVTFKVDVEATNDDWNYVNMVAVPFAMNGTVGNMTENTPYEYLNWTKWLQESNWNTNDNALAIVIFKGDKIDPQNYYTSYDLTQQVVDNSWKTSSWATVKVVANNNYPSTYISEKMITGLQPPETTFTAGLFFQSTHEGDGGGISLFGSIKNDYYLVKNTAVTFTTSKKGMNWGDFSPTAKDTIVGYYDMECGVTNLGGCVAQILFTIWQACSWVGRLAGHFLDFFVYYSTNSSSYVSPFISKGWGAVRDIANIFFIIALLYVAIKTILSMGGHDTKKLITSIILIALIINFSLFITQVVIDGSNILAKVFYNNITPVGNKTVTTGAEGEKSISIGLISSFNPQKIISHDYYVNNIGTFIFVTLLAIFVTLYTAYVFFAVSVLFLGRVAMLWLYMIFAPIAFASYTVPFKIPGFGKEEWWNGVLKNAFLAPIFIFLLYIIIMLAGFLNEVAKYSGDMSVSSASDMMRYLMSIIVPFAILMVLLMKAKKIAIEYSGEIGAALSKAGSAVAGLAVGAAVGAATGGAALLGRATLGKAGSALANSKFAKTNGRFGRMVGDAGKFLGKSSFDARKVTVGGKNLASTGLKVNTFGKPNEGGYEKMKADKMEKRQKRAKDLEVGPNEQVAKDVRAAEIALDDAKSEASTAERLVTTRTVDQNGIVTSTTTQRDLVTLNKDLAGFEKAVAGTERAVADAARELQNAIAAGQPQAVIQAKEAALTDAKDRRDINLTNITQCKDAIKDIEKYVKQAEENLTRTQNIKAKVSKDRQTAYAENLRNSRFTNFFSAGGQAGAEEAADRIRARSAAENKEKPVKH